MNTWASGALALQFASSQALRPAVFNKKMRVFVITGAGVSAESGIPTFRGKDGYWRSRQSGSDLDPMKLATPEAFAENPALVWEWYNERRARIRNAVPNRAHDAIARLAEIGGDFLLLTQNVDDLHARSGLSKQKMIQIHGDIFVTRCSRCEFEQKLATAGLSVGGQEKEIEKCSQCGALLRPGVVWFGEQLDRGNITAVESYLAEGPCDYVIVIGTTALFGYIIEWAVRAKGKSGELIEVNPEETPLSQFATQVVREPAASAVPRIVAKIVSDSCSRGR